MVEDNAVTLESVLFAVELVLSFWIIVCLYLYSACSEVSGV